MPETGTIIYYKANESYPSFPFKLEEDTFWTTQKVMAEMFDVESNTIGYHLQEIFKSEELQERSVTRKFRATATDGKKYNMQFYNLDAIIAVGYRVNSKSATRFRQWATATLHDVLMANLSESKAFRNMSEEEKRITIRNELTEHNKSLAEQTVSKPCAQSTAVRPCKKFTAILDKIFVYGWI